MMTRSCDLDYVFHDEEAIERSSLYSIASAPIYRGGETLQSESWSNNGAVAGLGSAQSGPGTARLTDRQDPQSRNTPDQSRVDAGCMPSIPSGSRVTGMGGMGSVQSVPVHPSLNTPIVLKPDGVPTRRVLDLYTSGSIDKIMSRLSAEGLRTNDQAEQ